MARSQTPTDAQSPTNTDADVEAAVEGEVEDAGPTPAEVKLAVETLADADDAAIDSAVNVATATPDEGALADARDAARAAEQRTETIRKAVDGEVTARGGTERHNVVESHTKYLAVEQDLALQALAAAGGDPGEVIEVNESALAAEAERLGMDVEVLIERVSYEYVRSQ